MYEQYFGLSSRPFQLNPDPDFFYGSRGHKRAMAYLEYGLHQGEGFIVMTGDVGAGKTTLVRNLLRKIPSETITAAQIVTTQLEADDLLRLVGGAFGLDLRGQDKSALLMRIEEHFRAMHAEGRRALLVVDEAQNLSPKAVEELRMLSNFQIGTRSLVQSFLVGQPEFREIMQRPEMRQLKQRIIASYHLGPLDRPETEGYILHRLRHVGWAGRPSFTNAAFDRIFQHSGAVPRRINTLCDRLLLATYLAEKSDIDADDVDQVAAELNDELGSGSVGAHGVGGQAGDAASGTRSAGLSDHIADPVSGRITPHLSIPLEERLSQMEDRIVTLETSVGTTYDMLKKVLQALKVRNAMERAVQAAESGTATPDDPADDRPRPIAAVRSSSN